MLNGDRATEACLFLSGDLIGCEGDAMLVNRNSKLGKLSSKLPLHSTAWAGINASSNPE